MYLSTSASHKGVKDKVNPWVQQLKVEEILVLVNLTKTTILVKPAKRMSKISPFLLQY